MSEEEIGSAGGNAAEGDSQQQQHYDWSAFKDDEGRLYYYNNVSGESSWDAPEEGFNPPLEEDEDGEEMGGEDQVKQEGDPATDETPAAAAEEPPDDSAQEPDEQPEQMDDANEAEVTVDSQQEGDEEEEEDIPMAGDWVQYKDDEGRYYYFNNVSQETTWDRPPEFDAIDETTKQESLSDGGEGNVSPDRPQSPPMGEMAPESPTEDVPMEDAVAMEEARVEEVEIDPAVQRLADAKAALLQPDAIMENGEWHMPRFLHGNSASGRTLTSYNLLMLKESCPI